MDRGLYVAEVEAQPAGRSSGSDNKDVKGVADGDLRQRRGSFDDAQSDRYRRSSLEDIQADQALEALGYKPELSRRRSTLQVAFMSFVLASIPYGLATTLYYPLIGGGPVNIIWGWLAVSLIIACVAASLGEITSVYPTAGGKLHTHATPPSQSFRSDSFFADDMCAVSREHLLPQACARRLTSIVTVRLSLS